MLECFRGLAVFGVVIVFCKGFGTASGPRNARFVPGVEVALQCAYFTWSIYVTERGMFIGDLVRLVGSDGPLG